MRYFSTCAEKKTFFIFKYFSFFFEILHKNFDTSLWKNLGIDCLAMFYSNWPRFRKIWRCISFLSTGNTSLQFFLCLKVWKNREKFKKIAEICYLFDLINEARTCKKFSRSGIARPNPHLATGLFGAKLKEFVKKIIIITTIASIFYVYFYLTLDETLDQFVFVSSRFIYFLK